MLTNDYIDGNSIVHTTRPAIKILLLFSICTILFVWENWFTLLVTAGLVFSLYRTAKISFSHMRSALKPAFWLLLMIFFLQLYLNSLATASFVVLRFVVMILAASLLTLTTKASELVAAIEQSLGKLLPAKTSEAIGLAFSLCFRFIPIVRQIFEEVREAQKARGHSGSWRALIVPTIVRTLKNADEISYAISARSIDTSYLSQPKDSAGP